MMKDLIRSIIQKILGYERYLFIFARFSVWRIKKGAGHEEEFSYFMKMIPSSPGLILDIGANIGVMSVSLAKAHPSATVYAFEPIPDNHATIEKMIRHYQLSNVQLFKTALGEEPGEIRMVVPVVGNSNMQGLSHVVESEDGQEAGQYFSVPVQRLDDIPELQQAKTISAIKIDVENFEYYVLKGAQSLLTKHRPVIYCELWNNERRKLCLDYMQSLGYEVKVYDQQQLQTFTKQDASNFFFVPST
jgi:FkbM family methyltransferase